MNDKFREVLRNLLNSMHALTKLNLRKLTEVMTGAVTVNSIFLTQ